MKVTISQGVKIVGDKYLYNWRKTYESSVIPHTGDCIEDPIWKDPYDYKVTGVTINYYADECFVWVENYEGEIPAERKEEFAHMASLHGWQSSWTMYKENV